MSQSYDRRREHYQQNFDSVNEIWNSSGLKSLLSDDRNKRNDAEISSNSMRTNSTSLSHEFEFSLPQCPSLSNTYHPVEIGLDCFSAMSSAADMTRTTTSYPTEVGQRPASHLQTWFRQSDDPFFFKQSIPPVPFIGNAHVNSNSRDESVHSVTRRPYITAAEPGSWSKDSHNVENSSSSTSFAMSYPPTSDSGYGKSYDDSSVISDGMNFSQELPRFTSSILEYRNGYADSSLFSLTEETAQNRRIEDDEIDQRRPAVEGTLQCQHCHEYVKTRSDLKKHDRRHTKPFTCEVANCTRSEEGFTSRADLLRHLKSKHPELLSREEMSKALRCPFKICKYKDKLWPRVDNFKTHLKLAHSVAENERDDIVHRAEIARVSSYASSSQYNSTTMQEAPLSKSRQMSLAGGLSQIEVNVVGDKGGIDCSLPNGQYSGDESTETDIHIAKSESTDRWTKKTGSDHTTPEHRSSKSSDSTPRPSSRTAAKIDERASSPLTSQSNIALSDLTDYVEEAKSHIDIDPTLVVVKNNNTGISTTVRPLFSPSQVASYVIAAIEDSRSSSEINESSHCHHLSNLSLLHPSSLFASDRSHGRVSSISGEHSYHPVPSDSSDSSLIEDNHVSDTSRELLKDYQGAHDDRKEFKRLASPNNAPSDLTRQICSEQVRRILKTLKSLGFCVQMAGDFKGRPATDNVPVSQLSKQSTSSRCEEDETRPSIEDNVVQKIAESQDAIDKDKSDKSDLAASSTTSDQDRRESRKYTCDVCGNFSGILSELRKHKRRHDRPYGCTYLNCRRTFGAKNDWKRHENSQHAQQESWRCDVLIPSHANNSGKESCSSSTPTGSDNADDSRNDKKECARTYFRRENFREHLKKAHSIKSPEVWKVKRTECRVGRNYQSTFWCGFCRATVDLQRRGQAAWDERFDHIDGHFMGRWVDCMKKEGFVKMDTKSSDRGKSSSVSSNNNNNNNGSSKGKKWRIEEWLIQNRQQTKGELEKAGAIDEADSTVGDEVEDIGDSQRIGVADDSAEQSQRTPPDQSIIGEDGVETSVRDPSLEADTAEISPSFPQALLSRLGKRATEVDPQLSRPTQRRKTDRPRQTVFYCCNCNEGPILRKTNSDGCLACEHRVFCSDCKTEKVEMTSDVDDGA